MKVKNLKTYQEAAVENSLARFHYARGEYAKLTPEAVADRKALAARTGCLLLEAPTGSGKTLMAARVLEEFSRFENVVWFWFAPFKGVTGQTAAFLKEQCGGLKVRDLAQDRQLAGTGPGHVFVTTWQTVAVRDVEKRNARQDAEQLPGTDTLVQELRKMGLRIGVVVDEAHHSFQGQSQAAAFYRDVLAPEYTVLITATPDDKDLAKWKTQMGVEELHRISISRQDAVDAGLVKAGVKCISFVPEAQSAGLVDMEMTCLRCATGIHQELKEQLNASGISLVPLLLVQADSAAGVKRAREKLMACGWKEEQIATHTAKEPDPDLMILAKDEKREVLIFMMAVALGFDAPRAWTLVSMRSAKDQDFGVQLLGRILRVHHRVQGKTVPDELRHGYVLLANPDSQSGLEAAGKRINALKTEMDKVTPTVGVVAVAGVKGVQVLGPEGQSFLFPPLVAVTPAPGTPDPGPSDGGEKPAPSSGKEQGDFFETGFSLEVQTTSSGPEKPTVPTIVGALAAGGVNAALLPGMKSYPLRKDVPRRFKSMVLPASVEDLEEDCAKAFMVDAEAILSGFVSTVNVHKRTLEVFTGQLSLDFEKADLSREEVARRAQELLFSNENFDPKVLTQYLVARLAKAIEAKGLAANQPGEIRHVLNAILLNRPGILREAQKKAVANHATLEDTEDLPEALAFDSSRPPSPRNVYRIYPPRMNTWEQGFAEMLDAPNNGMVNWWHRNEVKKPWSVCLVLPDGGRFYPDFVISVDGRKRENGILLADPKSGWEQSQQHGKVLAEHPVYGRALIIARTGQYAWQPIVWNPKTQKPDLGGLWGWDQAAGW